MASSTAHHNGDSMQLQHVKAIRPIASDILTIERNLGKISAQKTQKRTRLERRLRPAIAQIFNEIKERAEFFGIAQFATQEWGGFECNSARDTIVLMVELAVDEHRGTLSREHIAELRLLYDAFKVRCKEVFSSVHKLEIRFEEV